MAIECRLPGLQSVRGTHATSAPLDMLSTHPLSGGTPACRLARRLLEESRLVAWRREGGNPNKPKAWRVHSSKLAAATAAVQQAAAAGDLAPAAQQAAAVAAGAPVTEGAAERSSAHMEVDGEEAGQEEQQGSGSGGSEDESEEEEAAAGRPAWPIQFGLRVQAELPGYTEARLQHQRRVQRYAAAMLQALGVSGSAQGHVRCVDVVLQWRGCALAEPTCGLWHIHCNPNSAWLWCRCNPTASWRRMHWRRRRRQLSAQETLSPTTSARKPAQLQAGACCKQANGPSERRSQAA